MTEANADGMQVFHDFPGLNFKHNFDDDDDMINQYFFLSNNKRTLSISYSASGVLQNKAMYFIPWNFRYGFSNFWTCRDWRAADVLMKDLHLSRCLRLELRRSNA